jgi:hypothetical protein
MFDSISSNNAHSLALDREGRIWAWGSNNFGQFGNGTTVSSGIPIRIEVMDGGSAKTFKKVKAGIDSNSIALDVEGRLWTTGDDGHERLGNGSAGSSQVWGKISVLEAGAEVEFLDILTTRRASLALDRSGELWIWGTKSPQTPIDVPVKYPVTDSGVPVTFQTIDGNDEDAIALDSQDRLWRIFMVDPSPLKYPETSAVEFQSISAGSGFGGGYHFLLALDKGGSIWTWGGDTEGELGDGPGETAITYIPAKLTVMDSGTPVKFTQISGGIRHALALDDQGNMWAWGSNSAGQLGNNSSVKLEVPVKVPLEDDSGNPLRFTSVSAGSGKSFGLDADGQIWSWGDGQHIPKKMRVAPAVSLSASNVSPSYLQSITLTAVVTGDFDNPTGTVVFKDGSNVLGSAPLAGGTAQLTGITLSPGAHHLTANYEGDGVYLELASDQVTVTAAASPAKEITGFSFATPAVVGTVNEASRTISVTVPFGTDVTSLTPTITHTGASISPNSGVSQNFTNPVSYTVSAADGSMKNYTVTVNVAANPAKEITAFSFAAPAVTGTVYEASRTISVTVPFGTDVTSLTPTITHTGASISPNSGVSQNFTSPVTYTVSAADGTTQDYVVIVTEDGQPAPAAPQLLTADGADSQVALNWDTVTGATYYRVYLSTVQGVFTEPASATVTGVTYNMSGLTNGTTYYFIVKAANSGGLSTASNEAAAIPAAAPAAPTQVTAVAGDRQATISFTPPTDNGGSAITSYEVTASSGGVVQSGATSPITVTGLTNGVSYTFTVKAINRAGSSQDSDVSNAVIPSSPSSGEGGSDDNSDNSGNGDTSGTASEAAVPSADILLNRQVVHGGAAATTDHNRTLLTITADQTKLENRLAAEAQGAVITYRANASFDRVVAEMDGQWVKSMAQKQAVLALETGHATYMLPVQQIDIEALAGRFGESVALQDLKLNMEIHTRSAQDTDRVIKEAVSKGLFTLLAPPVEFRIQATYRGVTVEVSKFSAFLEHWIAIPDNVNPDSVTTAVVVEPDGILRYVPLQVMVKENRHYAKASSMTNGSFALVSHSAEFKDMTGHWAEQATRDMGARLIVMGTGDNTYEPDREVTRAEFAAILVRGLGLPLERGTAPFSDIPQSAWFNDVVATAYTHRLLNGFEDGTFHPEETITREQAVIMLSRAMTLTGLTAKLPGQATEEVLRPYTDAAAVSDWALDGMAASIQAGVMQGKSSATLAPQDFLTRAEAATIIQRLLQLSDLI